MSVESAFARLLRTLTLHTRPQAESAAVESAGQATAEARARAEAAKIEAEGAVKQV